MNKEVALSDITLHVNLRPTIWATKQMSIEPLVIKKMWLRGHQANFLFKINRLFQELGPKRERIFSVIIYQ